MYNPFWTIKTGNILFYKTGFEINSGYEDNLNLYSFWLIILLCW